MPTPPVSASKHRIDTALPTPRELRLQIPTSPALEERVHGARQALAASLCRADRRPIVLVGPCSVHDPRAAQDYAVRLARLARTVEGDLLVAMRVYFEKPRTTVGWKGLINDPGLDGSNDVARGLLLARSLLRDVAELGLPVATELLDPLTAPYLTDFVSWAAIGARTAESQLHRELASGLPFPVGFKNGTDGSVTTAVHAVVAAAHSHTSLGVDDDGHVGLFRTTGNQLGHVVLRGGSSGPNYDAAALAAARSALADAGVERRILVDASHGNSGKDYRRQPLVVDALAAQFATGSDALGGVMIESFLVAGRQDLGSGPLDYGQSVTDGCLDFETTERLVLELAAAAQRGRGARARRARSLEAVAS